MAISRTSTSVSGGASRTASGSPISVLKFSAAGVHSPGSTAPADVLRRGLAGRAGDPHHAAPRARGATPRQALERRQRVVGARGPSPSRSAARRRRRRARPGVDDDPPGTGVERPRRRTRRRRRARPAGRRRDRPAPTSRESIDRRARGAPPGAAAAIVRTGARGDPLRRRARSSRPARGLAERSSARHRRGRRTGPSGRPRTPGPARAPCRRSRPCRPAPPRPSAMRDRRAPVRLDCEPRAVAARLASPRRDDLRDDRLRVLRARVVGGDDGEVGQARGDLAHQRALVAVAVAAAAEHADAAAARRSSSARRAEDVLQRVGRVGVVDEHGERLALLDRLEAPGAPAPRRRERRGGVVRVRRRGRARRRSPPGRSRR